MRPVPFILPRCLFLLRFKRLVKVVFIRKYLNSFIRIRKSLSIILRHCSRDVFRSLLHSRAFTGTRTLPCSGKPCGKSSADKKKPHDRQGKQDAYRHDTSQQILHTAHDGIAGISAKPSAENIFRAENRQYERGKKGTAHSYERCFHQPYAPLPEKQPVRHGTQQKDKGKAAETEKTGHKETAPFIAYLPAPVPDFDSCRHHVLLRKQTLVSLPGEQIGNYGKESENHKDEDSHARALEQV